MNDFAQDPHFLQFFLSREQLFFTGTGTVVVDSREDAFFSDLTERRCSSMLPVPLKLFVNNFVHFRTGIDKRRRDNGQAAALFHVTRRTEEAFRTMKGIGVHTTGQHFT
ncbi:Uncharacterised protein [Escherichia coli]|uniref:Uncharacterized protein n=1 Tax=Escherichia coli TaxID=562 RepID=A0A376L4C0_ECOLX|nr:Uncharacterised protein [Escherichia coli]